MFAFLDKIPKHLRGWFYFISAIVMVVALAALLVVEIIQGGDAGEWLKWAVGLLGLGGVGLASRNTTRTKEFPPTDAGDTEADLP